MAPLSWRVDAADLRIVHGEMPQMAYERAKISSRVDDPKRSSDAATAEQGPSMYPAIPEQDEHFDLSSWLKDHPSQVISVGCANFFDESGGDGDEDPASETTSLVLSSSCANEPIPDWVAESASPSYPESPEFQSMVGDDDILREQHAILEEIERQRRDGRNHRRPNDQSTTAAAAAPGAGHPSTPLADCNDQDMAILQEQQAILDEIERNRNRDTDVVGGVKHGYKHSKPSYCKPASFCSLPQGAPPTIYEQDGEASVDDDENNCRKEKSLLEKDDEKHCYKTDEASYLLYQKACRRNDDDISCKKHISREKEQRSDDELLLKLENLTCSSREFGKAQLNPDHNVNILDRRHSVQAVHAGTAHTAKCSSCRKKFMVAAEATLLYCPTCEVLTPVDFKEATKRGNKGRRPSRPIN